MRILVITGVLAENLVKKQISESEHKIDVLVLPVTVAAFISPEYAIKELDKRQIEKYDMILLPGSVQGDVSLVEETTRIPTFKGVKHAAELGLLLSNIDEIKLSKIKAADEFITIELEKKALDEIKNVEKNWREILDTKGGFRIGSGKKSVLIGPGFPIRIIAEIVNAPLKDLESIKGEAEYYEKEGADIIDIGMLAGNPKPEKIIEIVNTIRDSVNLPISIDSLNTSEIIAAIDSKIDLILSLDSGNIEDIAPIVQDIPVVILPSNMKKGDLPQDAYIRVKKLQENIKKAKRFGVKKIIADAILEPPINPGIMNSLRAYQIFHEENPSIPILFGIGNVTELIDIDSIGANGLLTAVASEIGAQLLHVPEYSVKAKGSVREAVTASKMMFLAQKRSTIPKDLGLDLLVVKDKRWKSEACEKDEYKGIRVFEAKSESEFVPDRAGWFKILVNYNEKNIYTIHYPFACNDPDIILKGKNAKKLYQNIIRKNLVSKLDHAAYLGRELKKAEIALKLKKSYVQEEKLF